MVRSTRTNARPPLKLPVAQGVTANLTPFDRHSLSQLKLFPIKEVEVDGVAMGVLSDGTPYLTLRGLAKMCGVHYSSIQELANNWPEEQKKPRGQKVKELLDAQGHDGEFLNLPTNSSGVETHAYTDQVCMALLEYYAFDAVQGANKTALLNYRVLARQSFRVFIYAKCGYDPDRHIPYSWRNFHERVLLNDQIPVGYFSIFREIADLVVHMIKGGCPLDDHTVPDISVGRIWSDHWEANGFDRHYGQRRKYPHTYPEWYPQSAVNPVPAWIYPAHALGAFHTWMYTHYIPTKFPKYVENKVKSGVFLPGRAQQLVQAMSSRQLPPN